MKVCSVEGCGSSHKIHNGLCNRHYLQMSRHGKILERTRFDPNTFEIVDGYCKIGLFDIHNKPKDFTVILLSDVDKCKQFKWYLGATGYVICDKVGKLHDFIMDNRDPNLLVDHKNRNKLDNRKDNLVICSYSENNCNRPVRKDNKFGLKGVQSFGNKYQATIRKDGLIYKLGVFDTPQLAALAYNKAAKELHGEFAVLNDVKPVLKRRNNI